MNFLLECQAFYSIPNLLLSLHHGSCSSCENETNLHPVPIFLLHSQSIYSKIAIGGVAVWKFYCYHDGKNPDLWARWHSDDADERDRGAHAQTFDVLEKQSFWKEPQVKTLKGGLIQIKIRGSRQWRLLGFYYPKGERRSFTILSTCYHKDKRYHPNQDAIKMAGQRMKEIESGNAEVRKSARPK